MLWVLKVKRLYTCDMISVMCRKGSELRVETQQKKHKQKENKGQNRQKGNEEGTQGGRKRLEERGWEVNLGRREWV